MSIIYPDLHQFSTYVPPIDLTFHQYLLETTEPILVHTGDIRQAANLAPQLKTILKGRPLKYIFVSHFESDECGGLSLIQEQFPDAVPLCSEVTARQLTGFGLTNKGLVKRPGEKITAETYELEFFLYPSEMHSWDGLLLLENRRRIFFSSDLMLRFGQASGATLEANWRTEVDSIGPDRVGNPEQRAKLQQTLLQLNPDFAATGHGPCLKLQHS